MSGRIRVSAKADRTFEGITFASKAEMNRYAELRMAEKAGLIGGLDTQVPIMLQESFTHKIHGTQQAIKYICDFAYKQDGKWIYEDFKGFKTEIYKIKKKLLLNRYPDIDFREVKA